MRTLFILSLLSHPAFAQHDVNAGPIWNQGDANSKCPNICRPPERWSGQWRTTVPGRMSVCSCLPMVMENPGSELAGRYDSDRGEPLTLGRDGRYRRGTENGGWSFDGRTLTLRPDPATLALQPDGSFSDGAQRYA